MSAQSDHDQVFGFYGSVLVLRITGLLGFFGLRVIDLGVQLRKCRKLALFTPRSFMNALVWSFDIQNAPKFQYEFINKVS